MIKTHLQQFLGHHRIPFNNSNLTFIKNVCHKFLYITDVWGLNSEGFNTTAFPAAMAVINGLLRVQRDSSTVK